MKKILTVLLVILMLATFVGCIQKDVVLDEVQTYEITTTIHSLNIEINASDFKIVQGEKFSVESNLKYLSVTEKDGVLTVKDQASGHCNYSNAVLNLVVPSNVVFEDVRIVTGAAKLTVDNLSANSIRLEIGAGSVHIESLFANKTCEIDGGAGEITIDLAFLHNLSVDVGAGQLNLTAQLFGNSELNFGVGEANITLLGNKEDYTVKIEKGIGSINVEGQSVANSSTIGSGANVVDIDGGVGAINLKFQQS